MVANLVLTIAQKPLKFWAEKLQNTTASKTHLETDRDL